MRNDNRGRIRRHHSEVTGSELGGLRERGLRAMHDMHGGHGGHDGHDRHEGHGPRGPRGEGRRGGFGRGRAQRGDVRAAALILLGEQPMHGYQLMQAMAERTNGVWRPSPGAIYPTIAQLEDEGLVTTLAEGGRKLVTLTDAGRAYLVENADTMADPFAALAGGPGQRHDLRGAIEEVIGATRAIIRTQDDGQFAAAIGVLGEARRSLYLILAEGPAAPPAAAPPADGPAL